MEELFDRIRERALDSETQTDEPALRSAGLPSVATEALLNDAEQRLGMRLPPLLRRLYLEVANGGFGPGYGLIGVSGGAGDDGGNTIAELYEGTCSETWRKDLPNWPDGVVRICYWGCAMYSVVDCSVPEFPMFHFEPNEDEDVVGFPNCLIPHNRTFEQYMAAWVDGFDLVNEVLLWD